MNIDEDQLTRWAKAPSETEEGRCQHAVERITKAVKAKFGSRVSVFLQGSYKNRTNVKLDSDVDVVVRLDDIYFSDISGMSEADKQKHMQIPDSEYTFSQFKNDIQQILVDEFEYGAVERHDKCIKVKKNDQRVNADVVPCFVHKRFRSFEIVEAEGIGLLTDRGIRVHSFPEQHYDNGVTKNNVTDKMYKSAVRILKNIRNGLIEQNIITDKDMPSFLLECLVWNVPANNFQKDTYWDAVKATIVRVWNDMRSVEEAREYAEVNDLK